MNLITERARAYVYSGMWVADCPRACGNVEQLFDLANPRNPAGPRTVRRTSFHCSYCHLIAEIDWSTQEAEIMEVLGRRPVPHNRNWYPADHETAVKFRVPHGQSVQDLRDENAEHGVM
mgnify:CR=1 FL=1